MSKSIFLIAFLLALASSQIIRFNTTRGPKAIGPYSTATIFRGVAYISGQIGIDPATGELVEGDVQAQALRVMKNIQIIMDQIQIPMTDVLKATVYLKNMADFTKVNTIYSSYFTPSTYPSRSAIAIAELPKGALVEVEITAAYGGSFSQLEAKKYI